LTRGAVAVYNKGDLGQFFGKPFDKLRALSNVERLRMVSPSNHGLR
jgi:hypothetical protein